MKRRKKEQAASEAAAQASKAAADPEAEGKHGQPDRDTPLAKAEEVVEKAMPDLAFELAEERFDEQLASKDPDDPVLRKSAEKKIPTILRVFGVLNVIVGAALIPLLVIVFVAFVHGVNHDQYTDWSTATLIVVAVNLVLATVLIALFVVLGVRLLKNKTRGAARIAYIMIDVNLAAGISYAMFRGFDSTFLGLLISFIFLIVFSGWADPSLTEERELQRKLRDMETRSEAEDGTIGRDTTGEGYIKLNFFNLFWIFVVCCVLGLVVEDIYHFFVFGGYEDRAGLLFGPFSPIYGVGGVLITMALNRFYRANVIVIFLVSAVIGGAFEFFVSWFMQMAFSVVAWDYSGTFLNIDGRTNFMFMCMWGALGVVWVKAILPRMLAFINLIPWNWRYGVTAACATLMLVDCGLTLVALDSWYSRVSDTQTGTAVEVFCNEHFDNTFMQNRFQTMSIHPEIATRQ